MGATFTDGLESNLGYTSQEAQKRISDLNTNMESMMIDGIVERSQTAWGTYHDLRAERDSLVKKYSE